MKQLKLFFVMKLVAVLSGCGTTNTVPITGRKQTLMVSDGEVLSLASQQYQQFMKQAKPSTNAANTQMVKRVGQKLNDDAGVNVRCNAEAEHRSLGKRAARENIEIFEEVAVAGRLLHP